MQILSVAHIIGSIMSFLATGIVAIFFPDLFNLQKRKIEKFELAIETRADVDKFIEFLDSASEKKEIFELDVLLCPNEQEDSSYAGYTYYIDKYAKFYVSDGGLVMDVMSPMVEDCSDGSDYKNYPFSICGGYEYTFYQNKNDGEENIIEIMRDRPLHSAYNGDLSCNNYSLDISSRYAMVGLYTNTKSYFAKVVGVKNFKPVSEEQLKLKNY